MLSGIFEQTNECVIMDEVRKGKLLECGRIMHWLILLDLKRKETQVNSVPGSIQKSTWVVPINSNWMQDIGHFTGATERFPPGFTEQVLLGTRYP